MITQTAEQRLDKAIVAIMANPRYVALAGVLMIGERTVENDIPTACTDGKNERYGRAFVDSLNDKELRFLILHEVYHKLFKHLTTWKWMHDENHLAANMACDYVINVDLVDDNSDGFATMTGPLEAGCYDTKYRGWDSASVFRDLMKNAKQGKGGQGGPEGGGFDQHDWDAAKEMTEAEAAELSRAIDEAVRQGALMAAKTGSGGSRAIGELLEVQVDWREVMRDFITETCSGSDYSTWKRPNRRYIGMGHYMPSGISERVGELVTAVDTSGSQGQPEITRSLTEVAEVAKTVKPEAIRLLYWDTEVCADEQYLPHEMDNLVQSTKPAGGGGTMIECVTEHMQKEQIPAQAAIIFTDGYLGGGWGNWPCPVLWIIIDNKGCNPPFGTVVHVTARDL